MKTVFRPLALALLLVGTVMASACGRGKPVPTAPEPPVAAEATPAAPAAPATPAPTLPQPKPVAYKVEGGADAWHGVGIVCDFSKPFQLKGGGLTVDFTPASKDGGTYKYDGTLHGFRVYGGEAYSVEWIGATPVKMKGWGVGTVDTPIGPQSDNGIEHYTIERSAEPCPAV